VAARDPAIAVGHAGRGPASIGGAPGPRGARGGTPRAAACRRGPRAAGRGALRGARRALPPLAAGRLHFPREMRREQRGRRSRARRGRNATTARRDQTHHTRPRRAPRAHPPPAPRSCTPRNREQAQSLSFYSDALISWPPPHGCGGPAPGGGAVAGPAPARHWGLWAAFGGYGGPAAATDAADAFPEELARRMPLAPPPAGAGRCDAAALEYASRVRMAVSAAFLAVARRVRDAAAAASAGQQPAPAAGADADAAAPAALVPALLAARSAAREAGPGASATVAVLTGRLLTVANVGSARALLDAGDLARTELTEDDRPGCSEDEDARLAAGEGRCRGWGAGWPWRGSAAAAHPPTLLACTPSPPPPCPAPAVPGVRVAQMKLDLSGPAAPGEPGVGPPRVWPGGARHTRALGAPAAGAPAVLPHPHVRQVWLPARPSRLILATEGVWDGFDTWHKAAALVQAMSPETAAPALVGYPARKGCRRADRSAVVVDFVPRPPVPARSRSGSSAGSGSGSGSFKAQVRLDRLSRASRRSGSFASGGPPAVALPPRALSAQASGGSGSSVASPTASWPGASTVATSWTLGGATSRSTGAPGLRPASAAAAAAVTPRRPRSARALLAALLPRCVAPRGAAAAAPADATPAAAAAAPPGAASPASDGLALTVARLDAFDVYAGGRYGPTDQVLAALDAALRAAAAAAPGPGPADATASVVPAACGGGKPCAGAGRCASGAFVLGRASRSLGDVVTGGADNPVLRPSIALTE
jgi:hypothetical protein